MAISAQRHGRPLCPDRKARLQLSHPFYSLSQMITFLDSEEVNWAPLSHLWPLDDASVRANFTIVYVE